MGDVMGLFRTRNYSDSIRLSPLWKRRPLIALGLLLVGFGAVSQLLLADASDDFGNYHNRVFTVVEVADGDTFDIDHPDGAYPDTRIRLWGVDTPEVEGSRDGAMHFGAEASAFAKRVLLGRKVRVILSRQRMRDKYNRLLAYVEFVDDGEDVHGGESYNERLIHDGLAYADWRFDHPLKLQYKRAERVARENRIGLWAGVTLDDMPAWRSRMERELEYNAP
ncbi:MAG: thermonuclease family protein [Phycisphaerales bacterium]|nr:thermonuclease family protein [Phycisphaerales bacterium]